MNWQRLAQAVIDRRVELGFRTRESFATETGLSSRLLGDLERAQRDNFDRVTLARVEQALQWPAGRARAILVGSPVEATLLGSSARHVGGVEPSFILAPHLAAATEVTDQARRLSWLTGPDSPLGSPAAAQLAAAVEAVMAVALRPGVAQLAEPGVDVYPQPAERAPVPQRCDLPQ